MVLVVQLIVNQSENRSMCTESARRITWCYLGRVGYHAALSLQEELRQAILREESEDMLLLLEHPPVITLGRSASGQNVLVSDEERRRRGVELVQVGRGGDVTYHGPGQLVGYPVRRVGRLVKEHLHAMADSLVALLRRFHVEAWWDDQHPGIWSARGKIAAVGVDARGGVATHGFALNVQPALADFRMIVPCGIHAPVTSMHAFLGDSQTPTVEEVARIVGPDLCGRYGMHRGEASPALLVDRP
jgi:lipoate-protein ligase B